MHTQKKLTKKKKSEKRTASLPAAAMPPDKGLIARVRTEQALWVLRLLVRAGCHRALCRRSRWPDTDVSCALGLSRKLGGELNEERTAALLEGWLEAVEQDLPPHDELIWKNVELLGARLSLSKVAQELLYFAVVTEDDVAISECVRALGTVRANRLAQVLSQTLSIPAAEVRAELAPKAPLKAMGLARWEPNSMMSSDAAIEAPQYVRKALEARWEDADGLLSSFFVPASGTALVVEDFPHVRQDIDLLERGLRSALRTREPGVNVLIHGPSGTGKTELARLIATRVEARLYEVIVQDGDGDPADDAQRRANYGLCQRLLREAHDALVLFDEVEDILPRQSWNYHISTVQGGLKGWLNRTLETNASPTIWISNAVDHIDAAFIRRFDFTLELRSPPPKVRRKIFETYASDLDVSPGWLDRSARDDRVRPGHVQRAARFAKLARPEAGSEAEAIISRTLHAALRAEGLPEKHKTAPNDAGRYEPSFVNADQDLGKITQGLSRTRRGNLCLYGPPGTGKSAYAAHLAEKLGVALASYRASDLLDCWLGGTEQRIAEMFRSAREEEALLFLDEADSLLRSRERAKHSWELTQVNELLVQMETFEGIFVCATNLMDALDRAVLRRFALKVKLEALKPEQRWRMLVSVLRSAGKRAPRGRRALRLQQELGLLHTLTPGDYAAVVRKSRILGSEITAESVVDGVAQECKAKPESRGRVIGFGGVAR
jgi:transitional endoplasmic reticulum ATPase